MFSFYKLFTQATQGVV